MTKTFHEKIAETTMLDDETKALLKEHGDDISEEVREYIMARITYSEKRVEKEILDTATDMMKNATVTTEEKSNDEK